MFHSRQSADRKRTQLRERFKRSYLDLAPKRMPQFVPRAGVGSVLLAFLLMACSVLAIPAGLGWPPLNLPIVFPTVPVVFAASAVLIAGLSLAARGAAGVSARRIRDRASSEEPWMRDYHWNPKGILDVAQLVPRRRLVFAIVLFCIVVPVGWLAFEFEGVHWSVWPALLAAGITLFVATTLALFVLPGYLNYGRGELKFDRFPFHPGEKIERQVPSQPFFESSLYPALRGTCYSRR